MPNLTTDASVTEPVRLRPELAGVPAYRAGRPAPEGAFKVSSNENPYPPLPAVVAALMAATGELNRYPDFASSTLVARLAERFVVPTTHLAVGTGSVGVCQQIVQAVAGPGDEVVFAWRSFEAYPIIVQISGATSVRVPLRSDESHDLEAMAGAITDRTRLVLVCNPNNPTGTAVRRSELETLPRPGARRRPRRHRRGLPRVRPRPRRAGRPRPLPRAAPTSRCCARSPRRTAWPALRVGFAVAHEPVAAALRKTAVPFGVNSLAQVAAVASLDAEDELEARVRDPGRPSEIG